MKTRWIAGLVCLVMAASGIAADAKGVARAQQEIKAVLDKGCAAFAAGDIEGAMAPYSKDLFLYDVAPPYKSDYEHLKQANAALRSMMAEQPTCTYKDMVINVITPNFAYATYLLPYSAKLKNGEQLALQGRGTDIFRKEKGQWKIVHEHFSVPVDPLSGKAELLPPQKQ